MLLRAGLVLSLLFTLPILLIRAQPYQHGPLDRFFSPSAGCAAPCFLGIRPRQTDVETALAMLRANDAVGNVIFRAYRDGQAVFWYWSAYPHSQKPYGFVLNDGVIDWPLIPDDSTLGEVRMVLGEPDRIVLATHQTEPVKAAYVLEYRERDIYIFVGFRPCNITRDEFWRMRANGDLTGSFYMGVGMSDYIPTLYGHTTELDLRSWAKQVEDVCRR